MKNSMYALLSGRSMILSAAFLLAFVLVLSNCNTSEKKVASGEELFQSYCAICHGTNGAGNGAMTEHLKLPPADFNENCCAPGRQLPR